MKSPKHQPAPQKRAPDPPAVPAPSGDVAFIHGVTPDGSVQIIRRRGERLEAGALHPLRSGAPIQGEVVALRPRESCPLVCDVDVLYAPPQPSTMPAKPSSVSAPRRKGPAQVATDTYRDNWDSIWTRNKREELN